jgi:hypothetical protein
MDIDAPFLTAAAFRFEAARGVRHSNFETEFIADAELTTVPPDDLAQTLWHWLATEGADSPLRGSAYWALANARSRDVARCRRSRPRTPARWTRLPDPDALEDLGDTGLSAKQRDRSSRDHELNRAAAQRYLNSRP